MIGGEVKMDSGFRGSDGDTFVMPAQAVIQCFFLTQAMIDGGVKMDSRFRGNDVLNVVMPA
jgi:hypothetical protein